MFNLESIAETLSLLKSTELQDLAARLVALDPLAADCLEQALSVEQQERLLAIKKTLRVA
jgi:hypothetical protein